MEPVLQLCHPLFIDLSGRTRLQVAARFLAGNPMSAAECGHFCLTEQINALRRNFGVRFTEMFCSPYYPPEERSCDAPAQTLCARIEFFSEKKHFFHLFGFAFFKKHSILDNMFLTSLSSRGLGHRVFIPATRVRIPMGMPFLQKRRTRVEFVLETEAGQSIGLLRFFVSVCRRVRFSSAETRSSPAEGSPFYQIIFRAE